MHRGGNMLGLFLSGLSFLPRLLRSAKHHILSFPPPPASPPPQLTSCRIFDSRSRSSIYPYPPILGA
eukprot:758580-Hanusia_phi.AAC.2